MRSAFMHGFLNELEKIAVSEEVLRTMHKRVGAKTYPTARIPTARHKDLLSMGAGGPPAHMLKLMKRHSHPMDGSQGYSGGRYNPVENKIEMERNPAVSLAKSIAGKPSAAKAFRGMVASHEASERKYTKRHIKKHGPVQPEFSKAHGHSHPNVLVEEHNLLSRLKGSGPRQAGAALRRARRNTGLAGVGQREQDTIRELFRKKFKDPRAAQFLRPGKKVPKAMKKRFSKIIEKGAAVKLLFRSPVPGKRSVHPEGNVPSEVTIGTTWLKQHNLEHARRGASTALDALKAGKNIDTSMTNRKRGLKRSVKLTREQAIKRLAKHEQKAGRMEPFGSQAPRPRPEPPRPKSSSGPGIGLSLELSNSPLSPGKKKQQRASQTPSKDALQTTRLARKIRTQGKKIKTDPKSDYD